VVEERQFENICNRLLNAYNHILNLRVTLTNMKKEKPKVVSWLSCLILHTTSASAAARPYCLGHVLVWGEVNEEWQ